MSGQDNQPGQTIELGFISGIHGVKGWVKVHSYTQPREAILNYQPWLLGENRRPVTLVDGKKHGKLVIARLPDIEDRDQARALINQRIVVERQDLPDLPQDRFYWSDLQGLEVCNTEGVRLGRVASMLETGAHDVMVLEGEKECLVPFVNGQIVKSVDFDAGRIVVDWDPDY